MSKNSTNRYDSEGESDSTSFNERRRSPTISSATSAKEDSQAGPSGDYECNDSSSVSSPQYMSYDWSKFASFQHSVKRDMDIMDDIDCNDVYVEKLTTLRKQLNLLNLCNAELEENSIFDYQSRPIGHVEVPTYLRRYNSAPCYVKKLSANACPLYSIEENDEVSSNEPKNEMKESPLNGNKSDVSDKNELTTNTPRCIEVPPKKKCVRAKTPDYHSFENERLSSRHKKCVLRKVKKCEKATVSTQISGTMLNVSNDEINAESLKLNLDNLSYNSGSLKTDTVPRNNAQSENSYSYSQNFSYNSSRNSNREKNDEDLNNNDSSVDNSIYDNLPSRVIEDSHPRYLEPNIIILDTEKKKRKKGHRDRNRGDASTSSDKIINKKNDAKFLNGNNLKHYVLKKYYEVTSDVSSHSTPIYILSTTTDNIKPNSSEISESHSSDINIMGKLYSHTELEERELRTIDPVRSSNINFNENLENAEFDVKSIKSLIENFAEGVQPTRSFPVDFEDVNLTKSLTKNDQGDGISSFKDRGSDLLFAKSVSGNFKKNLKKLELYADTKQNDKSQHQNNLVDVRRQQKTDIEFYLVPSPTPSEGESEHRAGLDASDIYIDESMQVRCCFCLPWKFGYFS